MIFPSEIESLCNRMQPANGCWTENERADIKRWYKLVRVVKAQRHKTNVCKTRAGFMYVQSTIYIVHKPCYPPLCVRACVRACVFACVVCEWVSVWVHVCVCVCARARMHGCMCELCVRGCVLVGACVCRHWCMHVSAWVYVSTCASVCAWIRVCEWERERQDRLLARLEYVSKCNSSLQCFFFKFLLKLVLKALF
jgi:hypothetical protein